MTIYTNSQIDESDESNESDKKKKYKYHLQKMFYHILYHYRVY